MILERGEYFGRRIAGRDVGALGLSETAYGPREKIPEHHHVRPYVCYVIEGHFVERVGNLVRECGASRLIYHPSEEPHSDRFGTRGGRCFNVEIDPSWSVLGRGWVFPGTSRSLVSRRVVDLMQRLHQELFETDDHFQLAVEGLVAALMAEIGRSSPESVRRPPWIDRVLELLADRFAESLTLTEIADAVGVHPVHLSRSFSRHLGVTVGDTLRRLRLERARELLVHTETSISAIALAVGFYDHSHFARTFRREFGIPPGRFRNDHRG